MQTPIKNCEYYNIISGFEKSKGVAFAKLYREKISLLA